MRNQTTNELLFQIFISIIANVITAFIAYFFTNWIIIFFNINISPSYIYLTLIILLGFIVVFLFLKSYPKIRSRYKIIKFLEEDSASKTVDKFLEIVTEYFQNCDSENEIEINLTMNKLKELVSLRRQPNQIIEMDIQNILVRFGEYSSKVTLIEQILYYMDFIKAYKKMAIPRILRHLGSYIDSFGVDEFKDYVITYGHSSTVLEALISRYHINPFPIIVVEDMQYHNESLGEHTIVTKFLDKENVNYFLIEFQQIRQLFLDSANGIKDKKGNYLPLLKKRKFHAFLGCERIDLVGNTLIPAETRGVPSETALFVQEMESFAPNSRHDNLTLARIIILSESYKVRDYDKSNDIETNVPLRKSNLPSLLFILGLRKIFPPLISVDLYELKTSNIFAHINELGIFPKIDGKFDLSYCKKVFESETSLLGFTSKPRFLLYKIFDEINAILFDLNGVIIDDENLQQQAFSEVLTKYDIQISDDEYRKFFLGKSDVDGFSSYLQTNKISELNIKNLVYEKGIVYSDLIDSQAVALNSGSFRLLQELRIRGYKIALVTASTKRDMNKILQKFNIGVYFDILISADDVEHGKPSPEAYLLAASKLQVKPNKCLVIEDSLSHVQEARKIQMKTVYVNNNNEQITAGVSDFEVSSLDELLS